MSVADACVCVCVCCGCLCLCVPATSTFTLTLPQSVWFNDPEGAFRMLLTLPASTYRALFAALLRARQALLWYHPSSTTHEYVLQEAMDRAVDEFGSDGRLLRPLTPAGSGRGGAETTPVQAREVKR